jgi:hypothetical protein
MTDPIRGQNFLLSAIAVSQSQQIDKRSRAVRIVNQSSNIAYVRLGIGTQTASTSNTPILGNSSIVLEKYDYDNIGYISANGAVLNVQVSDANNDPLTVSDTVLQYNPVLWLDASDSNTVTIETGVSNWFDKSGNGNNAIQITGSAQPSYSNNSLTFDGINDHLNVDVDCISFYIAVSNTKGSATSASVCPIVSETVASSGVFIRNTTADYTISLDGTSSANTGDASVNGSELTPGDGSGENISIAGYVPFPDREQVDFIYFQLDSSVNWKLICKLVASSDYYSRMSVHEIIGYSYKLSEAQRQTIETHLTNKWL